ncbi:MAG TPA: 2OG-Fe(II) oxygenase [Rhizomicrobium sp.]|jgi:prolyl 4-hydroxylase|nr:2OG-Fe(II) oxygenase [Rhizomicrobium sp.]
MDAGETRASLKRAAETGDLAALTALGRHMLVELPYMHREGVGHIIEAAQKGEPDATHMVSVFAACGAGLPQDWSAAFDYMRHAAGFGSSLARAQLALLSNKEWQHARDHIDIDTLLATPEPRIVSPAPRISVIENLLPHVLCDWLIERARPHLKPAQVYSRTTAEGSIERGRTNSAMEFNIAETDLVVALVREKIARLTQLPMHAMEHTQVLHYTPGQQFFRHFDFFEPSIPTHAREIEARGQRLATFLIYLNENFEGGETDFPEIGWRYCGRKGDALLFWNVEGRAPDRRTLHAGLPTTRGEKWLLSQWIRGR